MRPDFSRFIIKKAEDATGVPEDSYDEYSDDYDFGIPEEVNTQDTIAQNGVVQDNNTKTASSIPSDWEIEQELQNFYRLVG